MKLSRREKTLLFLTLMIVIGACYYFFVFEKFTVEINTLKNEVETTQTIYDSQQVTLIQAANLGSRLEDLKNEIFPIASRYYGTTEQEAFITEIAKINKTSGINIMNINFSEEILINLAEPEADNASVNVPTDTSVEESTSENTSSNENTENNVDEKELNSNLELLEVTEVEENAELPKRNIKLMQAEIEFLATYPQIVKWLNAVDSNPKIIISGKLELKRELEEIKVEEKNTIFYLQGKVRLSFYQVDVVDKYNAPLTTFLKTEPIPKGKNSNPFLSYDWAWVTSTAEPIVSTSFSELGITYTPNIRENPITSSRYPTGADKPVTATLNKDELYGFEDSIIEVKKSDDKTLAMGEIETTKVASGNFAGKVQYTFSGDSSDEKVMIDLANKELKIDKKMDSINLQIYSEKESLNEVGLILTDANGQDYQIVMANEISWRGWKELNYDFHGIDKYPVKIKGIYVSYGEKNQSREGQLIFDNISLSYLSVNK